MSKADETMRAEEDAFRGRYCEDAAKAKGSGPIVKVPLGEIVFDDIVKTGCCASALYGGAVAKYARGDKVTVASVAAFTERVHPVLAPLISDRLVLAGGAVTSLVGAEASEPHDYDLFPIGADTPEEFMAIVGPVVASIIATYEKAASGDNEGWGLTRTECGVTLMCHSVRKQGSWREEKGELVLPPLVVQFVARAYADVFHVLSGFDLDACAMAFDGADVIGLPRCLRALRLQANVVDVARQSKTFESRLHRYAMKKGYDVIVPGKDICSIRAVDVLRRDKTKTTGLMHLLSIASVPGSEAPDGAYAGGVAVDMDCRKPGSWFSVRLRSRVVYNTPFPIVLVTADVACNHMMNKAKAQRLNYNSARFVDDSRDPKTGLSNGAVMLRMLIQKERVAKYDHENVYGYRLSRAEEEADNKPLPFVIKAGECESFQRLDQDWFEGSGL